jgi:hypothetical protein
MLESLRLEKYPEKFTIARMYSVTGKDSVCVRSSWSVVIIDSGCNET